MSLSITTKACSIWIFHSNYSKPSFRQIISKNIRDEKNKLTNTLKTLHQATTNDSYESVYLFW
jgi:hypothetical protein